MLQAGELQRNIEKMVYILGGFPQPVVAEIPSPGASCQSSKLC